MTPSRKLISRHILDVFHELIRRNLGFILCFSSADSTVLQSSTLASMIARSISPRARPTLILDPPRMSALIVDTARSMIESGTLTNVSSREATNGSLEQEEGASPAGKEEQSAFRAAAAELLHHHVYDVTVLHIQLRTRQGGKSAHNLNGSLWLECSRYLECSR